MDEDKDENPAPTIPGPNVPRQVPHDPIMQYFSYAHLPPNLQEVSKVFSDVANWVLLGSDYNPERVEALRKLLEAKDCAVRAKIFKT